MSSTDLPPYSGGYFECPKCGQMGARTTFMANGLCSHVGGGDNYVIETNAPNPRLHRECVNCGYSTDEATVEDKPATQGVDRRRPRS